MTRSNNTAALNMRNRNVKDGGGNETVERWRGIKVRTHLRAIGDVAARKRQ